MRRADHLLKTMSAVRGCVEKCRQSPAPMATLDEYLDGLRHSPQWADSEVAEVEGFARRAIQATTGNSTTTGQCAASSRC